MSQFNDILTSKIIEAVIKVHQSLGPAFVESIYHNALVLELSRRGMDVDTEKRIPVYYEGQIVGNHRLDLVIEQEVIVETKTVTALNNAHYAQVRSYLRAANRKIGLLVNFALEKADFRRIELP
jgi:GxxExxY protein